MVSTEVQALIQVEAMNLILSNGRKIWNGLSCDFHLGKIYSMVGESGSGKTCFALSLFGITPENSVMEYERFNILGRDWGSNTKNDWQSIRGSRISFVPQNPHLAFHPYRKVGSQVMEFLESKTSVRWSQEEVLRKWVSMGLREPDSIFRSIPSRLSGGEKQRIAISIADMSGSEIIIADEPTSSLDPIQARIVMEILVETVREQNRCLIFISHNLKLVTRISDEVLVVQSGNLVEKNTKKNGYFLNWDMNYSKVLWEA